MDLADATLESRLKLFVPQSLDMPLIQVAPRRNSRAGGHSYLRDP